MFANDEPALNDVAAMNALRRQEQREDDLQKRVRDMLTDPAECTDLHGTYADDEADKAIFEVIRAAGSGDDQACIAAAHGLRQIFEKWAAHRVEYQLRRAA